MAAATIRFSGNERSLTGGRTTIGRASDNDVAFPDDANVSRFHAEIVQRDAEFWLIDFGSINGTKVNGSPVSGERRLANGDEITLGGSARLVFSVEAPPNEEVPAAATDAVSPSPSAASDINIPAAPAISGLMPPGVSNYRSTWLFAGAAGGVAVVAIAAAGAIYLMSGPSCAAKATLSKPEAGDTITAVTEIEVDVENSGCVSAAVFSIDGVEFASAKDVPWNATIDPKEFPDLADGFEHVLSVALEDDSGRTVGVPVSVPLVFESPAKKKATGTSSPSAASTPAQADAKQPSLIEIQQMTDRLVKLFPGSAKYSVANKQFLLEIQRRTAEYTVEGFSARAAKYRDTINVAFVREQNLDAPLGFILAMSRSKFAVETQGAAEGLWRMDAAFAAGGGYTGLCGTETLADAAQNCAAKAAALYAKAVILGVFEGDAVYGVAAFGKSTQDAGAWKSTLPADRSDIGSVVRTPAERDQLIRFFAAGIVAENPQKFGLKKDRPLSDLYRPAM